MATYTSLRELIVRHPEWRARQAIGFCEWRARGGDKTTEEYLKEAALCAAALYWLDKDVGIQWPEDIPEIEFGKDIWEWAKQEVRRIFQKFEYIP